MKITPGLDITVRHYSLTNVLKGVVLEAKNNTVMIKLPKEGRNICFQKGDPLVVAYEAGDDIQIIGGRLAEFFPETDQLLFAADRPDADQVMRSYIRYPVSLYADFRLSHGSHKCLALVKDISEYGMMIYTKESVFKGQKFDFDIYLTRDILSLTAQIVRKTEHEGYFEYGLQIVHTGPVVFNHIRNLIRKAQMEHILKFNKEYSGEVDFSELHGLR